MRDESSLRSATARMAEALGRCQRAFAFYEPNHPAAQEFRRELETALHGVRETGASEVIIAASGEKLYVTGGDPHGLTDEASRGLSEVLVSRSVVGLKLLPPASPKDLEVLLHALAEAPARLRAAGGIRKLFSERDVHTVDVTEIDFESLLAGNPVDHTGLDPLVARAMTEALALKGGASPRGTAVKVAIARVESPDSLGSLLDELIDGAAPGVAVSPPVQPGRPASELSGMSANELAEACAAGYGKIAASAANPEALAEAARTLSAALVRLSPIARLRLLQRIADNQDDVAGRALGREVPDPVLLSAISQAVMGGARDSRLASAVGSLLERMRPIERDRQKLIEELGQVAQDRGRPLESMFLQQLGAGNDAGTVGALDLPFRETRPRLIQAARLRMASETQPEVIARTFATLRPESQGERTVRLFCAVMKGHQELDGDLLTSIREVFKLSAQDPALSTSGGELIRSLWNRAIQDGPSSGAVTQLVDVVRSETGPDWCIGLLRELRGRQGADTAMLLFQVLSAAVEAHPSAGFRNRLTEALDELDSTVQWSLERRISELPPGAMAAVLARAAKHAPTAAVPLARAALKNPAPAAKLAVLRALAPFATDAALELLAKASGLEGEAASRAALLATAVDPENLATLQRAAVETLGASRSPQAVAWLVKLMIHHAQSGDTRGCALAARALSVNNTPDAQAALASGRRSPNGLVRLACEATA